jgi:hypothetical protein
MMNEAPMIATVEEACAVISDWFGWKNLGGASISLPFDVPQGIEIVNHHLGRLWLEDGDTTIFNSQDTLISPHRYAVEPDGIVPMILENQGVWVCGFKPDTGAQLWVMGDWPGDEAGSRAWRPTHEVVDTAIIFVLLANAIWASADCQMDEDDKPEEFCRLLWASAPWAGFSGFWTNDGQTLLRMQGWGWGVTARRA